MIVSMTLLHKTPRQQMRVPSKASCVLGVRISTCLQLPPQLLLTQAGLFHDLAVLLQNKMTHNDACACFSKYSLAQPTVPTSSGLSRPERQALSAHASAARHLASHLPMEVHIAMLPTASPLRFDTALQLPCAADKRGPSLFTLHGHYPWASCILHCRAISYCREADHVRVSWPASLSQT